MVRAAIVPIAILVGLPFLSTARAQPAAPASEPSAPAPEPEPEGDDSDPPPAFGATAHVEAPADEPVAVADPETPRTIPGAFGDPYRVVESMPGATPMVSGLPYVYVRGSPPSGNAYYYDGIPLPQLFHLGVGPSILHPLFLGDIHFEPGVSSARYGRRLGAVITSDAPAPVTKTRGELELRLLDANGAVATKIGEASLMAAGRFGYPGLLAPALGIDLSFSYWDYQLRGQLPLDSDDRVELIAFGSYDTLDNAGAVGASLGYLEERQSLVLEFHRVEARLIRQRRDLELGTALRLGSDRTIIGLEAAARSLTLSPRVWLGKRFEGGHRLHLGADLVGAAGSIQELPRTLSFDRDAVEAVVRNTGGIYGDLTLNLTEWSTLGLGLRADAWLVGRELSSSIDPRLRFTVFPTDALELHAGAGLVHQPVAFVFPLPGFTDVAIDRGLQEGLQTELGFGYDWFGQARLEVTGFFHRYTDLLLPEIYVRALGDESQRADALTYGVEVFLVRPSQHVVSGWVSYTLGFARARDPLVGQTFNPEFDVRHVLSLVSAARLGGGWSASLAFRLRSGRPINQFTDGGIAPGYSVRLPAFMRLDGRIAYTFPTDFAEMEAFLEVLNATLAREAIDATCFFGECELVEAQPIWFPNLGFRASF